MRRYIQCVSAVVLLSAVCVYADGFDYSKEDLEGLTPQNSQSPVIDNPYARDGRAIYLYGGYMFVHRFWGSDTRTVTTGSTTLTYTPKEAFSSNFNAFQFVFGKELTRYVDAQFGYLQYLEKSKTSTMSSVAATANVKTNGVLGAIAFVFDPDYAFQVSMKAGAVISQSKISVDAAGATYYPLNDGTNVDPALGMDFLYNFTPDTGLRFGTLYVANVQNNGTHGDLLGSLAINHSF